MRRILRATAALAAVVLATPASADEGPLSALLRDWVRLEYRSDPVPRVSDGVGRVGRAGVGLAVPVAPRLRLRPGVQVEYLQDRQQTYREIEPRPTMGLELRF